jgi:pyrroline-5-carboxylate reductase
MDSNIDVVKNVHQVFICVKPNDVFNLMNEISKYCREDHLLISIAAGIKINRIEDVTIHNLKRKK